MSSIFPTSCNKCYEKDWCDGYYGGLGCNYKEVIEERTITLEGSRNGITNDIEEDVVREPSHYKHGTFETIDEMLLVFGPQKVYDYCIITAWKYRSRAPFKGKPEQDMEKANRYLEMAKEIAEANKGHVRQVSLIKESKGE